MVNRDPEVDGHVAGGDQSAARPLEQGAGDAELEGAKEVARPRVEGLRHQVGLDPLGIAEQGGLELPAGLGGEPAEKALRGVDGTVGIHREAVDKQEDRHLFDIVARRGGIPHGVLALEIGRGDVEDGALARQEEGQDRQEEHGELEDAGEPQRLIEFFQVGTDSHGAILAPDGTARLG